MGCQTPKPSTYIAPPIPKVASPMPSAKKAAGQVDDAIKQNAKMEGQIKVSKEAIQQQRLELDIAIFEAAKLKERLAKIASCKDVDMSKLEAGIVKARELNMALEKENKNLESAVYTKGMLLEEARITVRHLMLEVQALESTELALRFQLEGANKQIGDQTKYIDDKETEIKKLNKALGNAQTYKNLILGGFSLVLVLGIVFMALKHYRIL